MTDTSELEALKARVKQLEAAPAPVSSWGGLFSLVGSVVALVPRWLVVAAGVVFVAWLGFDLYLNAQIKMAEAERIEADSQGEVAVKTHKKIDTRTVLPVEPLIPYEKSLIPDSVTTGPPEQRTAEAQQPAPVSGAPDVPTDPTLGESLIRAACVIVIAGLSFVIAKATGWAVWKTFAVLCVAGCVTSWSVDAVAGQLARNARENLEMMVIATIAACGLWGLQQWRRGKAAP